MEEKVFLEERIQDPEYKEVRMMKMKCTDMKNNCRVVVPPARNSKEEVEIQTRKEA